MIYIIDYTVIKMNNRIYKINIPRAVLKGLLINIVMCIEFLIIMWSIEISDYVLLIDFIILTIIYMLIYKCKTEREHFIVFVSSMAFYIPVLIIGILLHDFINSFLVFSFAFMPMHLFSSMVAVIISMLLSSRYQKKHLIKEYINEEEVYYHNR